MKRRLPLRTFAVISLLLPGLVIAAPIAGPCGLCGDGDTCHMQQPAQTAVEDHSCCETAAENPATASLGSTKCECGREAPPALTAESPTTVDTASATTSCQGSIRPIAPVATAFSFSNHLADPPPAPPAYLIDCAFLT